MIKTSLKRYLFLAGEVVSEKSDMLSSCEGCLMSRLVNLRDIRRAEEAGSTANNAYFPECEVCVWTWGVPRLTADMSGKQILLVS